MNIKIVTLIECVYYRKLLHKATLPSNTTCLTGFGVACTFVADVACMVTTASGVGPGVAAVP